MNLSNHGSQLLHFYNLLLDTLNGQLDIATQQEMFVQFQFKVMTEKSEILTHLSLQMQLLPDGEPENDNYGQTSFPSPQA